jgi:hypothetical protein
MNNCCVLLAGLLLLGVSSCKKPEADSPGLRFVNGVPYYYFTEADKPWLKMQLGQVWRFENMRGYQRVYEIRQLIESIKVENRSYSPPGPVFVPSKLLNYYDQITVRLTRTDSISGGGELRFYRDAALLTPLRSGGADMNKSRFYAEGEWYEFTGNTDFISDYYNCRGLKFPSGPALDGPFNQLTVRGRQYNEVITFVGSLRGPNCVPTPPAFMQELYYDRENGIIRMVSAAGEVWDRLP